MPAETSFSISLRLTVTDEEDVGGEGHSFGFQGQFEFTSSFLNSRTRLT